MLVASKNLEQTTYTKSYQKKIFANMDALPHGYLIKAKFRFALNSAVAIETHYHFEHLEIYPQTSNNLIILNFWLDVQRNSLQLKHNDHVCD